MIEIVIPEELAGTRVDVALAAVSRESRHQIQKAIRDGRATLGGQPVRAKAIVETGQSYMITDVAAVKPYEAPNLTILYEDDDLMAIDKPADLAVHATETGRVQPTVAAFAVAHGVIDDDPERPGIVHRLDKDTSGVMVIAKHAEAKEWLQRAFKERKVVKTYMALVRGHLREDEAVIRLPIGRSRQAPVKRAVVPGAREAVTEYRVIRPYAAASLLEVGLHTGRTHQIRVHFQHLGHPVVGDILYGEPKRPAGLTRQFLHASKLELTRPNETLVSIESPLPADLRSYLLTLENQV